MRAFLLSAAVLLLPTTIAAQSRLIQPDAAPRVAFQRDSVAGTIPIGTSLLTIRAERGPDLPTTGRYLVLLDGRPLTAATSLELTLGAPSVSFVSVGQPSVVLLSTYTGGQGAAAVPGYYLKLIVLTDSGAQAFSLDSESVGQISSDQVLSLARPSGDQFQLSFWGGMRVRYANRQLDVTPGT